MLKISVTRSQAHGVCCELFLADPVDGPIPGLAAASRACAFIIAFLSVIGWQGAAARAQPVDVDWFKTLSAEDGILNVYLSTRIDGSVVVGGHTNRGDEDDYSSRSFFASVSATDGTSAHTLSFLPDRSFATAWSVDSARSTGGGGQVAIVAGSTGRGGWSTQNGGYFQVFARDRTRSGEWSRVTGQTTPDFQILTVGGLHADTRRFFLGSGRRNSGPGGGYRGLLTLRDVSDGDRILWQQQIPGFIVNIADIVVTGARMYVVGIVQGALQGHDRIGTADLFVAAYDISGAYSTRQFREPQRLWLRRFGTPGDRIETPVYATVDRDGHVAITGWTRGAFRDRLSDDNTNFTNDGYMRGFVIKVDTAGTTQWVRQFGGYGITVPRAITSDCYGNIWVAGATSEPFRRDQTPLENETRGTFIVRFDGGGNVAWTATDVLQNHATARDGTWSYITDIAIDGDGKLNISGFFSSKWGTQPRFGRKGFVARLTDRTAHGFGANGYFKCRAGAAPPTTGPQDRCPVPPDLTTWVNTCTKQSRPHEGFRGSPRCSNGLDDDGDGVCDAADPDCQVTERHLRFTEGCCKRPPDFSPEPEVWRIGSRVCSDGWDNDDNGRCDALEPACRAPGTYRDDVLDSLTPPSVPGLDSAVDQHLRCARAVQGRVPFGEKGSKTWNVANIKHLCGGAEETTAPATCFAELMSGRVSWGNSTKWNPKNALTLCAGTKDAAATLQCFREIIERKVKWEVALGKCKTD